MDKVALGIISGLVIAALIFNWRSIRRWGKWANIYQRVDYEYMNRTCTRYDSGSYRFIPGTEIVQEYTYDSQGGFWFQLSECESKAILENIYRENGRWLFREIKGEKNGNI
jgi:hypothetical protein